MSKLEDAARAAASAWKDADTNAIHAAMDALCAAVEAADAPPRPMCGGCRSFIHSRHGGEKGTCCVVAKAWKLKSEFEPACALYAVRVYGRGGVCGV